MFDLLGDRYQAALSRLALARLVFQVGARSAATRLLRDATAAFESLGAAPELEQARAMANLPGAVLATGQVLVRSW